MSIDWGNTLVIKNKKRPEINNKYKLWTELVAPKCSSEIVGNEDAKLKINNWFLERQCDPDKESACLLVHGPSGVGKSTTVDILAKRNGFNVIHTYADIQRTPQRMDALFREVSIIGDSGVLVLDDAESFIKETSVMRPLAKIFRDSKKNIKNKTKTRLNVVLICNEIDASFKVIRDVSETVEFEPLVYNNIYSLFRKISSKVSKFCYLPPMASYVIATQTIGNATQAINQLQLMYQGTPFPAEYRKRRKLSKNKNKALDSSSRKDNALHMWSSTYRQSSIECFVNDENLLESMTNMNMDFLNNLGKNLFTEYILYYHNSTLETMNSIYKCIDCMSSADIKRPENHEDRLYASENSERWAEDDMNYLIGIHNGIHNLMGKKKDKWSTKKTKKMKFEYV